MKDKETPWALVTEREAPEFLEDVGVRYVDAVERLEATMRKLPSARRAHGFSPGSRMSIAVTSLFVLQWQLADYLSH
ncbi:hypothetical protein N7461_008286 [Penicillium sp. DV-2018c]|nr:hypothetical protein N7461_008286 [Penicillium sp. DV-2018c]